MLCGGQQKSPKVIKSRHINVWRIIRSFEIYYGAITVKRVKARVAVVVYRPSAKQGYSYNDEKINVMCMK